ncbi:arrestin domain-containing protein 3-like isoform X2 [Adelges cooleyi]|uniref:arrestin domain-containing protein 3-like isoform X2 n=1 Tax=Adelges cooleyi TaxID=133065 RepID=UPI0021800EF8|nr:arrestin domain-containing protein 3-like isoform X2 [Adelges cooleyi]
MVNLNCLGQRFERRYAMRIVLRGKAHAEWKVLDNIAGPTVMDEQCFVENKSILGDSSVPILPRGLHQFPFRFQLPQTSLPCSFESKPGYIRYYIKVTLDIPYASSPHGMKYITVIGPHIDCMDDQYLKPIEKVEKMSRCCMCYKRNKIVLDCYLERTAYVCGEALRLKANIKNQNKSDIRLKVKLFQNVHYTIKKKQSPTNSIYQKDVQHLVLEYTGEPIQNGCVSQWDSADGLILPVMPPTLVLGICKLLQIYYVLQVCVDLGNGVEDLNMCFPITIGTVPFRIPNRNQTPKIYYSVACEHVEGGKYIGPEFMLGDVYDGTHAEQVVIYRPVYVSIREPDDVPNPIATS